MYSVYVVLNERICQPVNARIQWGKEQGVWTRSGKSQVAIGFLKDMEPLFRISWWLTLSVRPGQNGGMLYYFFLLNATDQEIYHAHKV